MPRSKRSSPELSDRLPLPAKTARSLAVLLGCQELPPQCATELEELLAVHLRAAHAEQERDSRTPAGEAEAAILKAMAAVRHLTRLDAGVDADTFRILKPRADAFMAAAGARLAQLRGLPRIYPHQEPLRVTGPLLRTIFEKHAQQGLNTRGNLRRFAFIALKAAGIVTSSVDEAQLERLDEYLDAELQLPVR